MDEKLLKETMASLLKDTSKRDALAQVLVEYIDPNHIITDWVGLLMPTRSMTPGDILVKKVRKGITVHTLVPGAIPLKSELTVTDRMNYVLDGAVVGVTANEWELNSGELGTVESIKAEMDAKVRDYIQTKVFTALTSVWTAVNTASNFTDVGASVTKAALDSAIQYINQNTATGAKTIVGTRAALEPIMAFAGWSVYTGAAAYAASQDAINQLRMNGWLGNYNGCNIMTVPQVWDNLVDYNKLVPENKILILGDQVGEFVTFGGSVSSQYSDPRVVPPQWVFQSYQQFGMIIDKAEQIYVIKVA